MSIDSLSRVQPDLLLVDSLKQVSHLLPLDDEKPVNKAAVVHKKDLKTPKHLTTTRNDHELLSERSRMSRTVGNVVDERRMIGGNAYAEHFIRELRGASLINRGPPGISNGSRIHWDLLLGRDETIDPCDYLNFDYAAKF